MSYFKKLKFITINKIILKGWWPRLHHVIYQESESKMGGEMRVESRGNF